MATKHILYQIKLIFLTIGTYDHPAAVDYIVKETGHSSVNYIGHSMGGTTGNFENKRKCSMFTHSSVFRIGIFGTETGIQCKN